MATSGSGGRIMDIFEFTGKVLFEDTPRLLFDKIPQTIFEDIPESVGKGLDNVSDFIDNILD